MNSRLAKVVRPLLTPAGLLVLVVVLGVSFVAIVLIPGLELAGEVAESSKALKLLGEQQRHPTLIRAALESGAPPSLADPAAMIRKTRTLKDATGPGPGTPPSSRPAP